MFHDLTISPPHDLTLSKETIQMQVTEQSSEGLKRKLKVVVAANELGQRLEKRIVEVKDRVQLKGFRQGKVPAAHIRKVYGRGLMSEIVQEAIRDSVNDAIKERNERAAQFPEINLVEGEGAIERIVEGKADLAYEMSFEVLPKFTVADFGLLSLEKLVAKADDEAIDKGLERIAEGNTDYQTEEGREAQMGDRVSIDYEGRIGGEAFEGGTGEGLSLVLGNANFIPGFEQGLVGAKAGETRDVHGTFPDAYPVKDLAGKAAVFTCKISKVEKPVRPAIDDELAKALGLENVAALRERVARQIEQEYEMASRSKLKRELLDALDKAHMFELPASLVEREFNIIWNQLEQSLKNEGKSLADEGRSEEDVRTEYRRIAERRVRLGLVIGEIGDKGKIEVTQDELRRAMMMQARRFPGQERAVYEYFEKTPGALQELRAPIFENKVVDHIISLAKPAERQVTAEQLQAAVEQVTQDTGGES
jgi:trigger factor